MKCSILLFACSLLLGTGLYAQNSQFGLQLIGTTGANVNTALGFGGGANLRYNQYFDDHFGIGFSVSHIQQAGVERRPEDSGQTIQIVENTGASLSSFDMAILWRTYPAGTSLFLRPAFGISQINISSDVNQAAVSPVVMNRDESYTAAHMRLNGGVDFELSFSTLLTIDFGYFLALNRVRNMPSYSEFSQGNNRHIQFFQIGLGLTFILD